MLYEPQPFSVRSEAKKSDLLAYYREHGPLTEGKTMRKMVTDSPPEVAVIVDYVQRILLLSHWSRAYGV